MAKFSAKKTVKYYVGCVQNLVRGEGLEFRFARYCRGQKFKWPEVEDLSLIDYDQIECRLDNPILTGRKHNFQFAVDFQGYNINGTSTTCENPVIIDLPCMFLLCGFFFFVICMT